MPRFSHPEALWLLALLPWFWWYARISARRATRGTALRRIGIAALLVLAASRLQIPLRSGNVSVIYALDRSDSMTPRAQAASLAVINQWSTTMRAGDRAGVVVFGDDAVLERSLAPRLRLADISSSVGRTGTDLAAALAAARAALGSDGPRRIVVFSDGCETTGDATEEAALTAAEGAAIDVIRPQAAGVHAPLRALRVTVPESVHVGEPFGVHVTVVGQAGTRGEVILRREGEANIEQEIVVGPDGTGFAAFTDTRAQTGLHTYRATVRDAMNPGEESASDPGAVVAVTGAARVLVVTDAGRSLEPVLTTSGFDVSLAAPAAMPAELPALAAFDAIVLNDIPPEQLTGAQASALARYVDERGGGLLLLGSARSLNAAGYPAGPIGPLLPVDLRPRAGRRAPAMSLVFVFDKSGSMADVNDGVPKIELARDAAMKLLDVVPRSDSVGIIAFDARPTVVAPLGTHEPAIVRERLGALTASGPTAMAPAIDLALRWLHEAANGAAKQHVLLLSDGRTPAEDMSRIRAAVRNARVQLSVVAIGSDADRVELERLAQSTGGRAYFPTDVRELPLIVAREAARSAAGTVVDEPFVVRAENHPVLSGIDRVALPRLGGYVVSAAKPRAESVLSSHLDDPVLAAWRVGLGKVAVYTAGLDSDWSAALRSWNGSARLWRQTLRWLHRQTDQEGISVRVLEEGKDTRLVVDVNESDGRFISGLAVHATIRPPDGSTYDLALDATAPGEYTTPLTMGSAGPYTVAIVAGNPRGDVPERRILRGFYRGAQRELGGCATGGGTLTRIAEMTGGHDRTSADTPFGDSREADYHDTSSWLLLTAVSLFFFELTGPALRGLRPFSWLQRGSTTRGVETGRAA